MSNYLVDGADLTSVANAIRTKGGTSAQLAFPSGFVSAVQAIETGGSVIPLPTGCTLLDYVDAPGSCLVDTGKYFTYPSSGFTISIKFGILDAQSTQIVCGTLLNIGNAADQVVVTGGRLRLDRTGFSNRFAVRVGDAITFTDSYTNATNGGGTCHAINRTTNASFATGDNANMRGLSGQNTFKLFGAPSGTAGGIATAANVRFYEMFYKEGTSEIIHLYPIRDSNGTYCLYDTVEETILYPVVGALVYNGDQLMQAGRILMGES